MKRNSMDGNGQQFRKSKERQNTHTHSQKTVENIGAGIVYSQQHYFFFLLVQDYGKFTYKNKCGTWINISVIIIFISVIFPSYNNVLLGEKEYEVMLVKENSNYGKNIHWQNRWQGDHPILVYFLCLRGSVWNFPFTTISQSSCSGTKIYSKEQQKLGG